MPALVKKARAIHDTVIALDTHVDIDPADFTAERNYTQRLDTQVDLPEDDRRRARRGLHGRLRRPALAPDHARRLRAGAATTAPTSPAIAKFDAIHRLTEKIAPDQIQLALTAADVRRINASRQESRADRRRERLPDRHRPLARVKEFYDRGARYLSLAHNGHSQLSDSNTGETEGWKWNGLSPLGKQVIAELNRVGIMIDVSHPSKASMMQAIELSKAPIIASHSSARALCNHSRNLDDEQLLALKKNGGVVQTVAFANYVKTVDTPERGPRRSTALRKEFGLPADTPLGGRAGGPVARTRRRSGRPQRGARAARARSAAPSSTNASRT